MLPIKTAAAGQGRYMARVRRKHIALGVVALLIALVALNVAGLLRYPGGPLRQPSIDAWLWLDVRAADQGLNYVGAGTLARIPRGELIYAGVALANASPWTATIERVELLDATPGLDLVDARLARPGTSGDLAGPVTASMVDLSYLRLDTDFQALPAELHGHNQPGEGRLTIAVIADEPGEYGYRAVAVDYRLGPFSFRVTHGPSLAVCLVPMPAGERCSIDDSY
jgi:hypothetical protein